MELERLKPLKTQEEFHFTEKCGLYQCFHEVVTAGVEPQWESQPLAPQIRRMTCLVLCWNCLTCGYSCSITAMARGRGSLEYYPVADISFIKGTFIFRHWWRIKFPMRVCNEFYIHKVTLCAVQCWRIKGRGVCTGGKDSEIVADIFGQDKGQS